MRAIWSIVFFTGICLVLKGLLDVIPHARRWWKDRRKDKTADE